MVDGEIENGLKKEKEEGKERRRRTGEDGLDQGGRKAMTEGKVWGGTENGRGDRLRQSRPSRQRKWEMERQKRGVGEKGGGEQAETGRGCAEVDAGSSRVLSTEKSHHPCGEPALQPGDRGQSLKPKSVLWSCSLCIPVGCTPPPDSRPWLMLSSPRPSALGFN